jgi:hypothetical protein
VGRLIHQVKPHYEVTSPRIIPGVIHLNTKNAQEPKRTPGRKEEGPGTPNRPLQTDLLKSGPH